MSDYFIHTTIIIFLQFLSGCSTSPTNEQLIRAGYIFGCGEALSLNKEYTPKEITNKCMLMSSEFDVYSTGLMD